MQCHQCKLTFRSSLALVLCSGFLTRHFETKSLNCGLHLSGSRNDGGGLVGIINIACCQHNTCSDHYQMSTSPHNNYQLKQAVSTHWLWNNISHILSSNQVILKTITNDRQPMTSYSRLAVTMALQYLACFFSRQWQYEFNDNKVIMATSGSHTLTGGLNSKTGFLCSAVH